MIMDDDGGGEEEDKECKPNSNYLKCIFQIVRKSFTAWSSKTRTLTELIQTVPSNVDAFSIALHRPL